MSSLIIWRTACMMEIVIMIMIMMMVMVMMMVMMVRDGDEFCDKIIWLPADRQTIKRWQNNQTTEIQTISF